VNRPSYLVFQVAQYLRHKPMRHLSLVSREVARLSEHSDPFVRVAVNLMTTRSQASKIWTQKNFVSITDEWQ